MAQVIECEVKVRVEVGVTVTVMGTGRDSGGWKISVAAGWRGS